MSSCRAIPNPLFRLTGTTRGSYSGRIRWHGGRHRRKSIRAEPPRPSSGYHQYFSLKREGLFRGTRSTAGSRGFVRDSPAVQNRGFSSQKYSGPGGTWKLQKVVGDRSGSSVTTYMRKLENRDKGTAGRPGFTAFSNAF
jgi:hypothetical protein